MPGRKMIYPSPQPGSQSPTEMTRILFRAGLKAEANIDFTKYESVKDLLEAMKQDKPRPRDKTKQTISIKVDREKRTVIRIDPILHAAIQEFSEQRGLKAHEGGFVILRAGFWQELLRPDELKNLVIEPIKP